MSGSFSVIRFMAENAVLVDLMGVNGGAGLDDELSAALDRMMNLDEPQIGNDMIEAGEVMLFSRFSDEEDDDEMANECCSGHSASLVKKRVHPGRNSVRNAGVAKLHGLLVQRGQWAGYWTRPQCPVIFNERSYRKLSAFVVQRHNQNVKSLIAEFRPPVHHSLASPPTTMFSLSIQTLSVPIASRGVVPVLNSLNSLTVVLGAANALAILMTFPLDGTALARGSNLTLEWPPDSTTITCASAPTVLLKNVDAQSAKATVTLPPTLALGPCTMAFLTNDTFDVITGHQVEIIDTLSISGQTSPPSTSATSSASRNTQSHTTRPKKLTTGAIVGIILGAVVSVIMGVLVVLRTVWARRRHQEPDPEPFHEISADNNRKRGVTRAAEKMPGVQEEQETLSTQPSALQRYYAPPRVMEQNEILQARIRMLERELQSHRGVGDTDQPPPQYLDRY
ncbi:hypothetical protein GGX14DRAFT_393613 [Mycena pura]|uniref:Transmembrane protein n=1 Tax=Mycena pura TaxID=153505 RepID=A0AAD6VH28_9AGAR|nr:hypothetical protein GGX14DRAFT_393613 [Mycena pura]